MTEQSDRIAKLDKLINMLSDCEKYARAMDPRDTQRVSGALTKAKDKVKGARGKIVGKVKASQG